MAAERSVQNMNLMAARPFDGSAKFITSLSEIKIFSENKPKASILESPILATNASPRLRLLAGSITPFRDHTL
jgi:hypothetical protein